MLETLSLQEVLDKTASADPTPGGGSIAALTAGTAAALVAMVANLTIDKKGYEDVQAEMKHIVTEANYLRQEFMRLMNADCAAFNQMMAGFKLPKGTEAEKQIRQDTLQQAYEQAASVPFEIGVLAAKLFPLIDCVAKRGNSNLITDAGIAAINAKAAIRNAFLNVKINFTYIKDKEFVANTYQDMITIDEQAAKWEHDIMRYVNEQLA